MAGRAAQGKRVQRDRSASMQRRLLSATVEALSEKGYSETTTLEVQRRAGVSRGALLHHFASRDELLVAAVSHLANRRIDEILQLIRAQPPSSGRIEWAVRTLWSTHEGPLFTAALELWAAASRKPELLDALLPQERFIGQSIRAVAAELFGQDVSTSANFNDALEVLLDAMRGAATRKVIRAPGSDERLIKLWVTLVTDLLA